MVTRNPHIAALPGAFLFPEISRRIREYKAQHPQAPVISLGIGDTTTPLPKTIANALAQSSIAMATREGYRGYGDEEGQPELRSAIAHTLYSDRFKAKEVFISDGSICDAARLAVMFGKDAHVAVQDPAYPVYVDEARIMGQKISFLPCTPDNGFFPDVTSTYADVFYLCSPHNPTGVAATYQQLQEVIDHAKSIGALVVYDSAYSAYVQDEAHPRSIFDVPGADEVAIELGSFSKMAGFTGVRLAWVVVPEKLRYSCGSPVWSDYHRVHCTSFNGASCISQAGGLAVLTGEGQQAVANAINTYMASAQKLRQAVVDAGLTCYGGTNSPYLWVKVAPMPSWEAFDRILEQLQIVTTPGAGYGDTGEGYIRLSALARPDEVEEACRRFTRLPDTLFAIC